MASRPEFESLGGFFFTMAIDRKPKGDKWKQQLNEKLEPFARSYTLPKGRRHTYWIYKRVRKIDYKTEKAFD